MNYEIVITSRLLYMVNIYYLKSIPCDSVVKHSSPSFSLQFRNKKEKVGD